MKNQIIAAISVITMLAACTEASEVIAPEEEGTDGVFATLEQPVSVGTRSFAYENDKLVFTWGEGENLMAIGDGDVAMFRTVNAGEASSKLESKGFQLMDGVDYYAYIPAKSLPSSEKAVPVMLLGQRQTTNNNSAHLKDFDYACAKATKDASTNSLNFNLSNQIGWIILEHTFAEAENIVSVTIAATDDIFVTEGTLDVTTSTISAKTLGREITLALGEEGGDGLVFATGDIFRGFFTVAPVDLSGKALTITAMTRDGKSIELGNFTKDNAKIEKNKFGVILTKGTAVASVDGKEYSSLKDAIAAASDGATISVVSDVTTEKVSIDKSVTFDLGGNTVTADDDVFYITEDGLTVNFTNGNIISTKYGGLFFKQGLKDENITFDNCNITGVEGAIATSTLTGSKITIKGGTFVPSNNAVILTNGNPREGEANTIIINGGTFKGQMSDDAYNNRNAIACGIYAAWKDNIIVNDGTFDIERGVGVLCRGGKVTIKCGTFTTTDPGNKTGCVGDSRVAVPCKTVYVDKASQYPDYENATIEISGGSFSDDTCKDYLIDGYDLIKDGSTYTVVTLAEKILNNTNELKAQLKANKSTAIVSEDVEVNCISGLGNSVTLQLEDGAVITGHGQTSGLARDVIMTSNGLDIKGKGKIVSTYADDRTDSQSTAIRVGGGTVNIYDGIEVDGGSGCHGNYAIRMLAGTVNIYGGYFHSAPINNTEVSEVIYLAPRTNTTKIYLNIEGGVFETDGDASYLINCQDKYRSNCTVKIMGGIFVGFNPGNNTAEGANTNFLADGYVSKEITYNGKQAWEVTKAE